MTKKKQFVILLAVLALLTAVYMGISIYKEGQQEKESDSEKQYAIQLEEDSIEKISYKDKTNTVTLEKRDNVWYNAKDQDFPLKQSCAQDVAEAFSQITANRKLSNPDALSGYGLEEPAYTVTLTEEDGEETVIEIGNTAADSDYYLTADKGKTIYTVSSLITESLIFDEASLLQTENLPEIESENLQSFTIKQKGKTLVSYSNKQEDDEEKLSDWASDLSILSLENCVTYKAGKKQLKKYGLNKNTRREITAVYQDSDSEENRELILYMGPSFEEESINYAYVQIKGSNMVYKVNLSGTDFS